MVKALKALDAGELCSDEWTCTEGVVLYRGRVYVPDNPQLSGCIQDQECTQCLGTCRALTYLRGVTQGEWVPAECLSRSEKKAAFSSYSSLALYNGWVTQRKELNKKAVTHY